MDVIWADATRTQTSRDTTIQVARSIFILVSVVVVEIDYIFFNQKINAKIAAAKNFTLLGGLKWRVRRAITNQ